MPDVAFGGTQRPGRRNSEFALSRELPCPRWLVVTPARIRWLVVALAFLLPLGFAAFTGHAWEDYFITLRASRNLVEGHGLVFQPGERVHTFTSPLGVLIPALCTALAGPGEEVRALWFFRIFSAALLAASARLIWRRADTLRLGALGRTVLFGLLLADAKLTDFATNGMETAILVFFMLLLWTELEAPAGPRIRWLGSALGGLMWTRPDAFVLAGALIAPHLLFRRPAEGSSAFPWRQLWRGALLGGLIYLPWIAWAWWYYGSPIPNTIIAKSAFAPVIHLTDMLLVPWRVLTGQRLGGDLFMPAYAVFGGWPVQLYGFARILTVIAAFAWLVPQLPAAGRRASLAVLLGAFYLCAITAFPWYIPPWTVLASIAVAFVFDAAYASASAVRRPAIRAAARIAGALTVLMAAATFAATAWQMRVQQRVVETGVRRDIGEWLRAHAAPSDTVFLEPLGYIGYFSGLRMYDFPGLSSPDVVRTVREGARSYTEVIARLQPQWIVLRPYEMIRDEFVDRPVLRDYQLVKSWSARPQLDAIRFLPGRRWCEFESQYLLFQRKPAAETARPR